ncbi:unnamed protein product [Urochloa humidicola]
MGRKPCCPNEGLNRGAWTAIEDDILVSYIQKHGEGKWGLGKPPQKSWDEVVWEELLAVVAQLPAPGHQARQHLQG